MQATEIPDASGVTIDRNGEYRIECYVRGTVPGPTRQRVRAVTDHLRRLHSSDVIADYRIRQWPPERHVAETSGTTPLRHELVSAFEQWAERNGYSLEPAFRRRELPSWPLGSERAETCERVRVPVVALALYDDADGSTASTSERESAPDVESLDGVVPFTEQSPGEGRTYTVDEWLSAIDTEGGDVVSDTDTGTGTGTGTRSSDSTQQSALGGRR